MQDNLQDTTARPFSDEEMEELLDGDQTMTETDPSRQVLSQPASDLQPRLWLINANVAMRRVLPANKIVYSFGASREESDVQLYDSSIAQRQLVIMRLGDEWVLADCGARDLVSFDGIASRQMVCPWGARSIATVGESTVIFIARAKSEGGSSGTLAGKRFRREDAPLPEADNARIIIESKNRQPVTSRGEALLVGSHGECDVTVPAEQAAQFHAMVCWSPTGIAVQALTEAPITVGDETGRGPFLLTERYNGVEIGGHRIGVQIEGDCVAHCRLMCPETPVNFENLGLTHLEHPEQTALSVSAYGSPLSVGRSGGCDVIIPDTAVSRVHAQMIPSGKTFYLIDNYSSNGTFVNGARATKARCRAGDVVDIGNVSFVVHYA